MAIEPRQDINPIQLSLAHQHHTHRIPSALLTACRSFAAIKNDYVAAQNILLVYFARAINLSACDSPIFGFAVLLPRGNP
jgi:hypothetical protein